MKHYYKQILSYDFVEKIANRGDFIDAQKGGLLLGNSHENGGVFMLYECPNGFMVMGEVEGWEFFLNWETSNKFRERIREINNITRDITGIFKEYKIPYY